jgi:hypothetical protein
MSGDSNEDAFADILLQLQANQTETIALLKAQGPNLLVEMCREVGTLKAKLHLAEHENEMLKQQIATKNAEVQEHIGRASVAEDKCDDLEAKLAAQTVFYESAEVCRDVYKDWLNRESDENRMLRDRLDKLRSVIIEFRTCRDNSDAVTPRGC